MISGGWASLRFAETDGVTPPWPDAARRNQAQPGERCASGTAAREWALAAPFAPPPRRLLGRNSLLIVDEIGYLPITPGGANLFFQLVNARHEKGAMILTSNHGFAERGEVFGDPVVATALLDRLLHQAVVVQIEGASYRLRAHADLIPDDPAPGNALDPGLACSPEMEMKACGRVVSAMSRSS